MADPLLTVCVITYNHVNYIRQTLDGILMQKTKFPFTVLIADDCSKDGTRDVLSEYQQKYPEIIRLILQEKNVGPGANWLDLINAPNTKYAAYVEGDDYWTDEYKLQKQVDFLEADPEFVCHTHNARVIGEADAERLYNASGNDRELTADDLITNLTIPTGSIVYRNCLKPMPGYLLNMPYDIVFYFALAQHGKFYQSADVMSVYRFHAGGAWSGQSNLKQMNDNIRIKEYYLYKMPLTQSQKRRIKQLLINIKLSRLKYYANNSFLSRNYFGDLFYLVSGKLSSFQFSMKYFGSCLLPDSVINIFKRG